MLSLYLPKIWIFKTFLLSKFYICIFDCYFSLFKATRDFLYLHNTMMWCFNTRSCDGYSTLLCSFMWWKQLGHWDVQWCCPVPSEILSFYLFFKTKGTICVGKVPTNLIGSYSWSTRFFLSTHFMPGTFYLFHSPCLSAFGRRQSWQRNGQVNLEWDVYQNEI